MESGPIQPAGEEDGYPGQAGMGQELGPRLGLPDESGRHRLPLGAQPTTEETGKGGPVVIEVGVLRIIRARRHAFQPDPRPVGLFRGHPDQLLQSTPYRIALEDQAVARRLGRHAGRAMMALHPVGQGSSV